MTETETQGGLNWVRVVMLLDEKYYLSFLSLWDSEKEIPRELHQ